MNHLLIAGTAIVNLALVCYSLFFWFERKKKSLAPRLLIALTAGWMFDVTATSLMILGSPNSPFTFHGFVGYSALLAMSVETFLIWRAVNLFGKNAAIPPEVHRYALFAYCWWVTAYITGAMIVILKPT
jgi:hypothetical protein